MTALRVDVVVVAYDAADALERCLAGLAGEVPRVIVVDNSSSSSVRAVASESGARYIDTGANLGFAAGVNVGLRAILENGPADVLLLNPDAVLTADDVARLAAFMRAPGGERLGAAAPRLVGPDGVEQRVLWPYPSPLRAWMEAVGAGRLSPHTTFAIGAALLLRWEAVGEVGLFDERFFLYAEEADWQRRALRRGWTTALCEDVVGRHIGAGTSADPLRREALFHAGQETYVRKWHGSVGWHVYRAAAVTGALVRSVALTGERRAQAARRAALYARGPRRCAGLAGNT